jgi:hypothetical protein
MQYKKNRDLHHADMILCPVSYIQMLKIIEWKFNISKTKLRFLIFEYLAGPALASGFRHRLLFVWFIATRAFIPFPDVSYTKPAIHSTWGC